MPRINRVITCITHIICKCMETLISIEEGWNLSRFRSFNTPAFLEIKYVTHDNIMSVIYYLVCMQVMSRYLFTKTLNAQEENVTAGILPQTLPQPGEHPTASSFGRTFFSVVPISYKLVYSMTDLFLINSSSLHVKKSNQIIVPVSNKLKFF